MEPGAFTDKSRKPTDKDVIEALRGAAVYWDDLKSHLAVRFAPIEEAWKFSGVKYGWTLQLSRKKRTLVYLTPCKEYFRASFAYGDKAVEAAHRSDLPVKILEEMDGTKKYPEGRPVRIEVRGKSEVEIVEKLASIKMTN